MDDDAADAICVDMVRTVRTPSEILPGTARGSRKKDTQESSTIIAVGTYICKTYYMVWSKFLSQMVTRCAISQEILWYVFYI